MEFYVYDSDDGDGVIIELDMENGISINLSLDEDACIQLIQTIQNKLDGHFK